MSHRRTNSNQLRNWQLNLLWIGALALGLSWLSAGTSDDFVRCWLIGFLPVWELTTGCLAMLMLHYLMGGNWGRTARPALEAGASVLPLMAVAFLPIAWHVEELYPWAMPAAEADPVIQHKAAFLNVEAWQMRAIAYYVIWGIMWWMFVLSRPRADEDQYPVRMPRRSAVGLILLVVTVSFAAIDWGMSLEPHWFSSIYGAIYVAGGAVAALAMSILAVAALRTGVGVPGVRRKRLRSDLGSLLLAMMIVWIYFAFSQFLIIWSADLPEENVWYLARGQGGWQTMAGIVLLLHFVVPFAMLISENVRMHPKALTAVAVTILAGHVLYRIWVIAPAFYPSVGAAPWGVFAAPVGMMCLWGTVWLPLLNRRKPQKNREEQ